MKAVREFARKGGLVGAGDDAGFIYQMYGFGFIRELELLQEAGFHPIDVIQRATGNNARILGMEDQPRPGPAGLPGRPDRVDENPLDNFKLLYPTGVPDLKDGEAGPARRREVDDQGRDRLQRAGPPRRGQGDGRQGPGGEISSRMDRANQYKTVRGGKHAEATRPVPIDDRVVALIAELRSLGSERDRAGMARYGINVENAFGVSIYELRKVAKRLGTDHELALALWATGNHEARLLACFVDDPAAVTEQQIEAWAGDFDSWDICDQATTSLFDLTEHAWTKAVEWAGRDEEWVKRGGFALMAGLAVHDKAAADRAFIEAAAAHRARRPPTTATSSRRRSTGRCATSASATGRSTPPPSPAPRGSAPPRTSAPAGSGAAIRARGPRAGWPPTRSASSRPIRSKPA